VNAGAHELSKPGHENAKHGCGKSVRSRPEEPLALPDAHTHSHSAGPYQRYRRSRARRQTRGVLDPMLDFRFTEPVDRHFGGRIAASGFARG
jgi:hypothetical protein